MPGYEPDQVEISWQAIEAIGEDYYACTVKKVVPHNYYMLVDTFAEVRLKANSPPPNRDELREILSQYDNQQEMVTALEAL